MPELERILKVDHAHKPPETIEKGKGYNPREQFSQEHLFLIIYGDIVKGRGSTLLSVLHRFVMYYADGDVNTLHLLPFFPYSSDRGLAVIDNQRVDERLGSSEDIRNKKRYYDLMFDAVLNHNSSLCIIFQEFLKGNPAYSDFFIAYESPDDLIPEQRCKIFRPRTSDFLTRFQTIQGPQYLWTTFLPDQVDFNLRNPAILMQVIKSILFYNRWVADLLRLDAVIYSWVESGTDSVNFPHIHEIVKLQRDVVELVASGVAIVTETDVPYEQTISYSVNGFDEAHMVYKFALPTLAYQTYYTGGTTAFSRWVGDLHPRSDQTAFLHILDTHDGIGLQNGRGLLLLSEIQYLVEKDQKREAIIFYELTEEGTEEPYEINSTCRPRKISKRKSTATWPPGVSLCC